MRGGAGFLIDGSGLVLTIGYLIMEADEVELRPDGLNGRRVRVDGPASGAGVNVGDRALAVESVRAGTVEDFYPGVAASGSGQAGDPLNAFR